MSVQRWELTLPVDGLPRPGAYVRAKIGVDAVLTVAKTVCYRACR